MAALATTEMPRPSRGGRPRDPSRDGVIRAAILRLLAEVGYGALTMDAVASEAGVGKATIYRRWRTKQDLVVDTISDLNRAEAGVPDTGSLEGDLRAMLHQMVSMIEGPVDPVRIEGDRAAQVLEARGRLLVGPAHRRHPTPVDDGVPVGRRALPFAPRAAHGPLEHAAGDVLARHVVHRRVAGLADADGAHGVRDDAPAHLDDDVPGADLGRRRPGVVPDRLLPGPDRIGARPVHRISRCGAGSSGRRRR